MIPSERIRNRIAMLQKARDACLRRWNKTRDPKTKELLQLTTETLTASQSKLEAELHLLTNDGATNGN